MSKTYKPLTITTKRGTRNQTLVGMADVLDKMTELAEAAADCTPAWDDLGRLWERRMNSVFATANQGRWTGFAPSTIREHQSPLVDEGIMEEGMTRSTPRYSDKHLVAFGPPKSSRRVQGVATLNTVGHRRGSQQVPPRPVVPPLTSTERREWLGVIESHIREALNG